MAAYVISAHHTSISRACRVVNLPKSMYYYTSTRDDGATISKLRALAEQYPTEGQDLYYRRIRREGLVWNYKRVRRVYLLLGMNRRRKVRRRVPARVQEPLVRPAGPLQTWSLDFMHDVLTNRRKFRTLNVIDDYNRQAIAVEVADCMPAERVVSLLDRIIAEHGKPQRFRTDNGPEFISATFRNWCREKGIDIQFIQPGSPCRMVISSGSTGRLGKMSWTPICSRIRYRYKSWLRTG